MLDHAEHLCPLPEAQFSDKSIKRGSIILILGQRWAYALLSCLIGITFGGSERCKEKKVN